MLIAFTAIMSSCKKEDSSAEAFVGKYLFNDTYFVIWGNDSRSLSGEGAFEITKLSGKKVKMTGAWTSVGEVNGDTVSFADDMQSDNSGYITYRFGTGTLSGKTLRFNYNGTGSLKYSNGVAYPYTCSGNVIATKID